MCSASHCPRAAARARGARGVASLSVVGALLATALFVVPAATTRLCSTCRRGSSRPSCSPPPRAPAVCGCRWRPTRLPARRSLCSAARLRESRSGPASPRAGGLGAVAATARSARRRRVRGRSWRPGPVVVATTTQIGDFARDVGGDRVGSPDLQPNTDPHDYEPRPDDVRETADAEVVFQNGDELDDWSDRALEAGGAPRVVDLGRRPGALPGESEGDEASGSTRTGGTTRATPRPRSRGSATRSRRPTRGTRRYRANAAAYSKRLRALDAGSPLHRGVPAAQRKLVTDHDAFNYFAGALRHRRHRRGDPVADDAGAAQRARRERLVAVIRRENVRAIFPERSLSPKLAERSPQTGTARLQALRGRARPGRLERRDVPWDDAGERRRDHARVHRRQSGCAIEGIG